MFHVEHLYETDCVPRETLILDTICSTRNTARERNLAKRVDQTLFAKMEILVKIDKKVSRETCDHFFVLFHVKRKKI